MTRASSKSQAIEATTGNRDDASPADGCIALLGNPNTGKTTLFNRLCGLRARTANFPGTTVEARVGRWNRDDRSVELLDLPGTYGLDLEQPESRACRDALAGEIAGLPKPDTLLVIADATNLHRNMLFVLQVLREGRPTVVALNMSDLAQRGGLTIDTKRTSELLGCPVVSTSARTGDGIDHLQRVLPNAGVPGVSLPDPADAIVWVESVIESSAGGHDAIGAADDTFSDRLDEAFTHPVLGLIVFAAVMTGLYFSIFALATIPMDLIEWLFSTLGEAIGAVLPAGLIHDLLVDGVVSGIAGTVVFLPQICLLFFLISLLEDTGYLARAAFVMDRIMRRFGLPGQSFVPLLSAHACAIPAIMSTRLIPGHRDRIATILIAPFMSCSARLPVYVLLIGLLFPDNALRAGLAFTGCYVLGAVAALATAMIARRTVLPGETRAMMLELPSYKIPSLRNALLMTIDRGLVFLRKAGTVIVGICIILWWLSAYPTSDPPATVDSLRADAIRIVETDPTQAESINAEADRLESRAALSNSFAGRAGRFVAPVFEPIGVDWQLSIGLLTSFAAREVFVSTMAVVLAGTDDSEDPAVIARIRGARRDDGTPLFTKTTAASLLVFYVLAMQCLPTLPVTAREAGGWKWAALQFGYMTVLAYVAALAVHVAVGWLGVS